MAELTDAQKVLRNDTGKRIAAAIEALGGTPPINLGMTGASVGQVPVINTVDANGAPTSYRPGAGGSGGTSDYDDLTGKPSINGTTLSGNKTAAQLGLGTYSKPSGGIPASDLASAVLSPYRTAAAQDAIDAGFANANEVGIVINGKRPARNATAGQYVIVRNSTISGITDGLYTANAALSPSTDVTAANLTAISNGGLNSLSALIDAKHVAVWPTPSVYSSARDVVNVMTTLPTKGIMIGDFEGDLMTDLFTTASSYGGIIVCFKSSGNNIYYLAYSRDVAAIGNINIPNVSVTYKHSLL